VNRIADTVGLLTPCRESRKLARRYQRTCGHVRPSFFTYEAAGRKLFDSLLFSITMQYMSLQFFCHRHPFLAPGALASIYEVAMSADKARLQCGHRGVAPFLKRPPHAHGRRNGSIAAQISCCPGQFGNRGILLSHSERIAVLPQESQ
jgi:hypothetical protein